MTIEYPPSDTFAVFSATDVPHLYRGRDHWEQLFRKLGVWPAMLAHDVISQKCSNRIDHEFLRFQMVAATPQSEHPVVGIAHTVPLYVGDTIKSLPDTGWDWAIETALAQHSRGVAPDSLCGLSITVLPNVQRRGVGAMMIAEILSLARRLSFKNVIMPVRPLLKAERPLMSMEEFATLRRDDGLHQDPWVRTHQKAGALIRTPCNRSMTIVAPVSDWEIWNGAPFSISGVYCVEGALAPVQIDVERGVGRYYEPNLWMHYAL